jgi:hypothetical protein
MLAEELALSEQVDLPGAAPAIRRTRSDLLRTSQAQAGLRTCGCTAASPAQQGRPYAPFTTLAEAGQVLRRTNTDTCGSWNPWDPNYPHQGPMKETMKESNSSAHP